MGSPDPQKDSVHMNPFQLWIRSNRFVSRIRTTTKEYKYQSLTSIYRGQWYQYNSASCCHLLVNSWNLQHIISQSSTIIQNSALRITYVVSILGITNTFPFVEVSFSHHYFTIIMSHTRKRSEIWNHFSESSPNKVKCLYCKDVISTTGK